jgi:hypothetical protein
MVTKTKELLSVLEKSKHQGWRDIITGDQSLFGFYYGYDGKWCLPEEKKTNYEWKQDSNAKSNGNDCLGCKWYNTLLIFSQMVNHIIVNTS